MTHFELVCEAVRRLIDSNGVDLTRPIPGALQSGFARIVGREIGALVTSAQVNRALVLIRKERAVEVKWDGEIQRRSGGEC